MKMSKHPSWIQRLRFILPEGLRESPFGNIPKLHLNELEPILQKHLHAPAATLDLFSVSTLDLEHIYEDLGPEPYVQAIHVEPIKGSIFLVFRATDIEKGHLFLTKGKLPSESEVFKGVVKFLALKGLSAIDELHLFKGLSMTLKTDFPLDGIFEVFDLNLQIPGLTITPRLIVPEKTLTKIKEFYQHTHFEKVEKNYQIDVPLHLNLTHVSLTKKEIKSLQKLDLIHLTSITDEVLDQSYQVKLFCKNTPLLSAHFKDHHLHGFSPIHPKPQEKFMPSSNGSDDEDFSDYEEDFEPSEENEGVLKECEEDIYPQTHHKKPVALEEIGLDCKIELGTISVPYETLANLTYESTLKVDLDPKQVFLTLNGQVLRRGEIVAFDQQLFFKVLE